MARFYGSIGFAIRKETKPGVFRDYIEERPYVGDIVRNTLRWQEGSTVNDTLRIDNAVSVIADPYIITKASDIRYAKWQGTKWKVQSIQIQRPRITLQLNGIYHDQV